MKNQYSYNRAQYSICKGGFTEQSTCLCIIFVISNFIVCKILERTTRNLHILIGESNYDFATIMPEKTCEYIEEVIPYNTQRIIPCRVPMVGSYVTILHRLLNYRIKSREVYVYGYKVQSCRTLCSLHVQVDTQFHRKHCIKYILLIKLMLNYRTKHYACTR